MSFVHGKGTGVYFDATDLSAYLNSAEFEATVDTAESTTFGASWKTFIPGLADSKFDFGGYFDPTYTSIWGNVGDEGSILTVGPSGVAVGAPVRLMKLLSESYKESAPVGDIVSFDWSVQGTTALGFGNVIAARAVVAADGNGATFDGLAATTAGAIAHLHVFSVSASDSIVVTIEDASVPSGGGANWATIGTFASKSAAGAERILIAGAVRRYLRAVDDVTGSAISIDRAVAVARL